jgi:hypothetical protein
LKAATTIEQSLFHSVCIHQSLSPDPRLGSLTTDQSFGVFRRLVTDSAYQGNSLNKLRQLGWMINEAKLVLIPTPRLEHLGFILDTTTMKAELPKKKVQGLKKSIAQILKHPSKQTHRLIHSLAMRLQSSLFAILPVRLYTRRLLYFKNLVVKSRSD